MVNLKRTLRIRQTIYFPILFLLFLNCKTNKVSDNNQANSELIKSQINSLAGYDLGTYLETLKRRTINLNDYREVLINKLKESEFPYDIYILSDILVHKNREIITSALNSKISIWDTGKWGNKFWTFIKTNNLNIELPNYYEFIDGVKKYVFKKFIYTKIQSGELGQNPLLFLNDRLTDYEEGNLINLLKGFEIIQIDYIQKSESVGLFGKRGIDGKISVMTK